MFPFRGGRLTSSFPLLLLSCASVMVESGCPLQCYCPRAPPSCPAGVSLTTDSCGCCRVCARQFNQDCDPSQPCDHIKGLHCQMGVGGDAERGLCRAEALGRPCELDGRLYQHGEDFQPDCQHQCSCMDGVVGCMPLCPHQVPLPDWRCSTPRLARLPGRCCEEWVCDDDNHVDEDSGESQLGTLLSPLPFPQQHPGLASNEVVLAPTMPQDASARDPIHVWMSLPRAPVLPTSKCFPQTTDWSSCSTTCGMGISSRVTNSNAECRLVMETRLCQVRQCDLELPLALRAGSKCERTVRPRRPVQITFAGCSTVRRYRPRSCGFCTDGLCCTPSLSRTVRLRFGCPGGGGFVRSVMWIQRCLCHENCPRSAPPSQPPGLPSDIHTYAH